MMVTVKKVAGGFAVVIPMSIARAKGLIEGTRLEVSATPAGVILTKPGQRPRRHISQIVAQIDPASYRRHTRDLLQDGPVGREIC